MAVRWAWRIHFKRYDGSGLLVVERVFVADGQAVRSVECMSAPTATHTMPEAQRYLLLSMMKLSALVMAPSRELNNLLLSASDNWRERGL